MSSIVDQFKSDIGWAKPIGSGRDEDERAIMHAAMCRRMLGIVEAIEKRSRCAPATRRTHLCR